MFLHDAAKWIWWTQNKAALEMGQIHSLVQTISSPAFRVPPGGWEYENNERAEHAKKKNGILNKPTIKFSKAKFSYSAGQKF